MESIQDIFSQFAEAWPLRVIGCPQCKSALVSRETNLYCPNCQTDYPVEGGIPTLLSPRLRATLREGKDPVRGYYLEERYDWTRDPKALEFAYHRYRRWTTWNLITKKLTPGNIVLDLGCGTGLITQQFIGRPHCVIALDLNRWALSHLDGKPRVSKIQADGESLPIQDESVDLIVATEMIEHLPSPQNATKEVYRVCKPGGQVIGSVPSTSPVWNLRQYLSLTCGGGEPFHHNYSKDEITELWEKAGFKVLNVRRHCLGLNWIWTLKKP